MMIMTRLIVTVALVTSTAACTSSVGHPSTTAAPRRSNQVAQLGGNELRFGAGATAVAGVVYQPDVVLIGGLNPSTVVQSVDDGSTAVPDDGRVEFHPHPD